MKKTLIRLTYVFSLAGLLNACTKDYGTNYPNPGFVNASDTAGSLKDAVDFPVGVAIDYNPTLNDANYMSVVKREFDAVTFSYNMKHGAIVQDDGTLNFTNADAMMNAASGLEIFGHTLGWHENQNASYLKSYAQLVTSTGPNLLETNGGFENGSSTSNDGWYVYNSGNPAGSAVISVGAGTDVRTGSRSMKVYNPTAYGGDQWRVQIASDLVTTTPGEQYTFSYWVKAASAGGSIRMSTQDKSGGNAQYQGDQSIGTSWQQVTWSITANSPETRFFFDMGAAANTYDVDDVTVTGLVVANPDPVQISAKLSEALNSFITGMINHYKGKVKSWDVVNEVLDNSGNIRNNANSPNSNNANDYFVWSSYMGRDFALKAFQYAAAADPTANLFINDYGLESNPAKLDSLIAYVAELKSKGAKIDGIGTQMHIYFSNRYDGIDNMMQKLAATGLKIRISELDVRVNPNLKPGYVYTPLDAYGQEEMYRYVIQSYLKYIPKAQQFGITVWGLSDDKSWLYNNGQDFPLLFNSDYSKKSTYAAVLEALKGK